MKSKGFNNQIQLTEWVNNNLVRTAVVNIVWIAPALVLFYRERDKIDYVK